MFKKIVSNLPFSPALVGQLGFYIKRLRSEEITRRFGLLFLALALVVQSLSVFQAPESANASSSGDIITGGIPGNNIGELLKAYDNNTQNFKDVMNYAGITKDNLAATKLQTFKTGNKIIWSAAPHYSYADGEREHKIYDMNGNLIKTVYSRPLSLSGSPNRNFTGWVGQASFGWFSIRKASGNVVTELIPQKPVGKCRYNYSLLANDKDCLPCPNNETISIKDKFCTPDIIRSTSAVNNSQGSVNASSVIAKANDQISYTLTIENTGSKVVQDIQIRDNLSDVLEYANISEPGGGTYDKKTKTILWPDINLNPKSKQTRTFTVTILGTIPATAVGASNDTSYDCIITNTFGNSVSININCPKQKILEQVVANLPIAGINENILFSGIVFAIVAYFYARSRQHGKEIRLIRKDISMGTI